MHPLGQALSLDERFEPPSFRAVADHQQIVIRQMLEDLRREGQEPVQSFLRMQPADKDDRSPPRRQPELAEIRGLDAAVSVHVDAVGDNHAFVGGNSQSRGTELGHRTADAHYFVRAGRAPPLDGLPEPGRIGHTHAVDERRAEPASRQGPDHVGVEQERLDDLRLLFRQQSPQSPDSHGELPDRPDADEADGDAGILQLPHQR